jgi:hypothetical protein
VTSIQPNEESKGVQNVSRATGRYIAIVAAFLRATGVFASDVAWQLLSGRVNSTDAIFTPRIRYVFPTK